MSEILSENEKSLLILGEVKKAIDCFIDKTYEMEDFYSHIMAIIRDNSEPAMIHKQQLERFIFLYQQLRANQALFFGGNKSKLTVCRLQETELDNKAKNLLSKGYDIKRFTQQPPAQGSLL